MTRTKRKTRALGVMLLTASGCVSSTAGIDQTSTLVNERLGVTPRLSSLDAEQVRTIREKALKGPIGEKEAVTLSLVGNPQAEPLFARLGIARAEVMDALRLPNPQFFGAFHSHDDALTVSFGGTLELTQFLLVPFREQAKQTSLDASSVMVASQLIREAASAKASLYRSIAAEQLLELEKKITFAHAQNAELARQLSMAGNLPELTLLEHQARYQESRLGLREAEARSAMARESLRVTLGLAGEPFVLQQALPALPASEPDWTALEDTALAASLDIVVNETAYRAAARELDAAETEAYVPRFSAGVSAEHEGDHWNIGPLLSLELPLLSQGQGRIASIEAAMAMQAAAQRRTTIVVQSAAISLRMSVEASRERAAFFQETVLPLRKRISAEAELQYNSMNLALFDLLFAKVEELQAEARAVQALRDYWLVRAELDSLLAGALPSRLAQSGPSTAAPTDSGASRANVNVGHVH